MKKIILDCDPGMDDSMAIVMACKSEALDVLAVTTVKGKVKPGDNPFLLKRLYILRTDSLETMSRLISNQPQG